MTTIQTFHSIISHDIDHHQINTWHEWLWKHHIPNRVVESTTEWMNMFRKKNEKKEQYVESHWNCQSPMVKYRTRVMCSHLQEVIVQMTD